MRSVCSLISVPKEILMRFDLKTYGHHASKDSFKDQAAIKKFRPRLNKVISIQATALAFIKTYIKVEFFVAQMTKQYLLLASFSDSLLWLLIDSQTL